MRWPRRKPFDPRTGGSAEQQGRSAQIDEQLAAEQATSATGADILVLGTPQATADFIDCWAQHLGATSEGGAITGNKRPISVNATDAQDEAVRDLETSCSEHDVTHRSDAWSVDNDMAELANELQTMGTYARYASASQTSHGVDLIAASYLLRFMHTAHRAQDETSTSNGRHLKQGHVDETSRNRCPLLHDLPVSPGRRNSSPPSMRKLRSVDRLRFQVLDERNLSHPKASFLFESCHYVIVVIDINTLHETDCITRLEQATWPSDFDTRYTSGNYQGGQFALWYLFTGVSKFKTTLIGRSPADVLGTWFDDFAPTEDMQRSDDPRHTYITVMRYLCDRLGCQREGERQLNTAILGSDDAVSYRFFRSSLVEWIECWIVTMCGCPG